MREVVDSDLDAFFEHQREPEANRMAAFPARDREFRNDARGSVARQAVGVLVFDADLHEVAAIERSTGVDPHRVRRERGEFRTMPITPLGCCSMSVRPIEPSDDFHRPDTR
jgi:hypothetical protein